MTAQAGDNADVERASGPARYLYGSFGEALAQAFEFAIIPVLFGLVGLWLDRRYGIGPWATVGLLAVGLSGVMIRTLYAYKARVEEEERGKPWTRRAR